jgi:anti-anti-sigma factor
MLITLVVAGADIFITCRLSVIKTLNMLVKTDTKEKFHAITLPGPSLSATMTEELDECLLPYLQNDVKNIVLILGDIENIDNAAAEKLVSIQQQFYENGASFVICGLQKQVEEFLDKDELLEMMNVTPTQSEAWDIVQMEEIERELLDGDETLDPS